jgi:predicted alpha/beta-hydrolase family hydrolase
MNHSFMSDLSAALYDRSIATLRFNFPYMEAGRKVPDRAPVLESSFRDVIAQARQSQALAGHRLFIGGKSMGGRLATHLGADGVDDLAGVIALGYPLHPPGRPEQLRVAHLPRVSVPLLIVQGERDTFGAPSELAPHVAGIPGKATVHVIERGDHSLAVRGSAPEQVRSSVIDVIRAWMASV